MLVGSASKQRVCTRSLLFDSLLRKGKTIQVYVLGKSTQYRKLRDTFCADSSSRAKGDLDVGKYIFSPIKSQFKPKNKKLLWRLSSALSLTQRVFGTMRTGTEGIIAGSERGGAQERGPRVWDLCFALAFDFLVH